MAVWSDLGGSEAALGSILSRLGAIFAALGVCEWSLRGSGDGDQGEGCSSICAREDLGGLHGISGFSRGASGRFFGYTSGWLTRICRLNSDFDQLLIGLCRFLQGFVG